MERKVLKELVQEVIPGLPARYLKGSEDSTEGIPCRVVNINNIADGKIDVDTLVVRKVFDKAAGGIYPENYALKDGDVLLSMRGSTFKAAIVDHHTDFYAISSNLSAFRLHRCIIPQIVVAYLNSAQGQQELKAISRGVGYPYLYTRDVLELQVPFPPSRLQTKILSYCNEVDTYLAYLKREENLVREIQKQAIASTLEVNL